MQTHAFIYKADGLFQCVKDFEFSAEEKLSSSGCRELLAVHKMVVSEPDCFTAHKYCLLADGFEKLLQFPYEGIT